MRVREPGYEGRIWSQFNQPKDHIHCLDRKSKSITKNVEFDHYLS